ncbi:hypothetical protein LTR27_001104 [Elasticomyces elasticus]|nr:hypothetical protein LTR27_001104 [Elasticomyces elasticus]
MATTEAELPSANTISTTSTASVNRDPDTRTTTPTTTRSTSEQSSTKDSHAAEPTETADSPTGTTTPPTDANTSSTDLPAETSAASPIAVLDPASSSTVQTSLSSPLATPISATSPSTTFDTSTTSMATSTSFVITSTADTTTMAQQSPIPSFASIGNNATNQGATNAPNHGITAGDLAGGIIGAALGAALLAAGATYYFIMRKSSNGKVAGRARRRRTHRYSTRTNGDGHEKAVAIVDTHAWEQHLPQGEDDRTIQTTVKALFDQVQLHIENFYRTADVHIDSDLAAALSALSTPHLAGQITTIMASSRSHLPIMKHCLAYLVAESMSGSRELSLLPLSYRAVVKGSTRVNEEKLTTSARQAYNKWRVLTAYLQPEPLIDPRNKAANEKVISELMQTFAAFSAWEDPALGDTNARVHLEELFRHASTVAVMLWSQPSTYDLSWPSVSHETGRTQALLVAPALEKVADQDGVDLRPTQILTRAVLNRS